MHARSGQLQGIFGFLKPLIHVWILVWSWSVDKNDPVDAKFLKSINFLEIECWPCPIIDVKVLVHELVSAKVWMKECCIAIGCTVLLLSLILDVLHRTSHPEFKHGREVIFPSVKYEAQNLMRPTLDLNKIQATITTAHQRHLAIGGIFRKFRMRPIEVSTTPWSKRGTNLNLNRRRIQIRGTGH